MRRRLVWLVGTFVLTLVLSTLAFALAEGQHLGDAFYWVCMTVSSVGYGDISPKSTVGKALAIYCGFVGVGFYFPAMSFSLVGWLFPDPHKFTEEEQNELLDYVRSKREDS